MNGREPLVGTLYELLFAHVKEIHLLPVHSLDEGRGRARLNHLSRLPADKGISPVGFGPDENLFPYHPTAHAGYRLLQEYFAFPKKYQFFDLDGINFDKLGALFTLPASAESCLIDDMCISNDLRNLFDKEKIFLVKNTTIELDTSQPDSWFLLENKKKCYQIRKIETQLYVFYYEMEEVDTFDIWIVFDKDDTRVDFDYLKRIGMTVNRDNFQLGCTPAINLFDKTTEPIRLDHTKAEYPLVGDYHYRNTTEIHTIKRVTSLSEWGAEKREVAPFYSLKHTQIRRNQKSFWQGEAGICLQ